MSFGLEVYNDSGQFIVSPDRPLVRWLLARNTNGTAGSATIPNMPSNGRVAAFCYGLLGSNSWAGPPELSISGDVISWTEPKGWLAGIGDDARYMVAVVAYG